MKKIQNKIKNKSAVALGSLGGKATAKTRTHEYYVGLGKKGMASRYKNK